MRLSRLLAVVLLLVVASFVGYRLFSHPRPHAGETVGVYYVKADGHTLAHWNVSLGTARDLASVAFYATAQTLAGPPPEVPAIRFPVGTVARSVHVTDAIASVDLGGAVATEQTGSLAETGEFRALVWTLTALPGIAAVQVRIDGARVATLPGGHLELDAPLSRQSW